MYTLHPNSSDVDSSSVRFQYFDNNVLEEYERESEEEGKTNTIHALGLKYEVVEGDATDSLPDPDGKEVDVDGVKFIIVKDDAGFTASQVNGIITGSNKVKKDLITDLQAQIKLVNAQ